MSTGSISELPLPGCALPLNFTPHPSTSQVVKTSNGLVTEVILAEGEGNFLFPTLLQPNMVLHQGQWRRMSIPMLTLREISMLEFMNKFTDKENWVEQVFDEAVVNRCKSEILSANMDFTPAMADYCIQELRFKAPLYLMTGAVNLFHGDVVKADNIIPTDLKKELQDRVSTLENIPENKKDWHPGSSQTVLDLVHPSIYPLVYGVTRIYPHTLDLKTCLERCCGGETVPEPPEEETYGMWSLDWIDKAKIYSPKFQWLPCDVDISGESPKILGYINNLHPEYHSDLYEVIEKIIGRVIPLWNLTLTPLREFRYHRRIELGNRVEYPGMFEYLTAVLPQGENEHDGIYKRRQWNFSEDIRAQYLLRPNPPNFRPPPSPQSPVDLKAEYGRRGLQIIVKLANIHLTPENPNYYGGSWHVEGQSNEHICASAIYYYDSENVTSSELSFSQYSDVRSLEEFDYERNDSVWLKEIFGFRNYAQALQYVGAIETREDRIVTFPNIIQHRVGSFKLVDRTRPGHRKILALFLVDPNIKIISTANVPCQQREWWADKIVHRALERLPVEIRDLVVDEVDDPAGLETAKEWRGELMEERSTYTIDQAELFGEALEISLCEH